MHDIDSTFAEFEEEYDDSGMNEFEEEFESGGMTDEDSPFSEDEEMEMASELMEISSDEELEYFIKKLFKRAAKGAKRFARSSVGRKLGGYLKGVAKKALPWAGRAAGMYFGGPAGAAIGGKLGGMARNYFGLELEGLEPDEMEFETARSYVRLAGTAARNASVAGSGANPKTAAQKALMSAAKIHAPGLIGRSHHAGASTRSGRWIRRGNRIILMGV